MRYTREDIIRMVEEEDVEFIRLQFTDIYGNLKNMAVTSSQLEKALNNKCTFDGESIQGYENAQEKTMYLYPDVDTFEIFPWRPQQGKVARLFCDVYTMDEKPYEADPRRVLKKVVEEAKAMGYEFNVGPECEFFLFNMDDNGLPTVDTMERAGYFDCGPVDFGENARRDIVLNLEQMDFTIESSHHEQAPAQHEVDFRYDTAVNTADNIQTFKLAVKTIAKRHGLHATFMPKPKEGCNGSGMHINMSLSKAGRNVFYSAEDKNGLSREAYAFMAGIAAHIEGITAVVNPLVNSYKRISNSCSAIFKIPKGSEDSTRIEFRSPDPSANPYLALALCLKAGLRGIAEDMAFDEAILKDWKSDSVLPGNLGDALRAMENDSLIKECFGDELFGNFMTLKKLEWKNYMKQVTDWEITQYLDKY